MAPHGAKHSVSDIANARLNGQESGGQSADGNFSREEFRHVLADPPSRRAGLLEGGALIRNFAFHHPGNLCGIELDDGASNSIGHGKDAKFAAMGRVGRLVNVVHAEQRRGVRTIQLDQHFLRRCAVGGGAADGRRQQQLSVRT